MPFQKKIVVFCSRLSIEEMLYRKTIRFPASNMHEMFQQD